MKITHATTICKKAFVVLLLIATTFSCTLNSSLEDEEVKISNAAKSAAASAAAIPPSLDPRYTYLTDIELNLSVGQNVTGSFTIGIMEYPIELGKPLIATLTVPVSSLSKGERTWNKFTMRPNGQVLLTKNKQYVILVHRDQPHDVASGNYIFWRGSLDGGYSGGWNDYTGQRDYAFKTYALKQISAANYINSIDQYQLNEQYRYGGIRNYFGAGWQVFTPRL